ncbi:MAG: RluA family pseudouridine synthase [Clostridia bacterium]|nr:RluA family pseudouridine synthase [Clostridia bacterium]
MKFFIGGEDCGSDIRSFLTNKLELSRRAISALKNNEKGIVLNNKRVTVRAILSEGDVLELTLEEDGYEDGDLVPIPIDIPIDVIYEDEALTVVNKPYGMPTILSHGHYDDTLANALAFRYRDKSFVMRAVNRLDRDTSGICLVANSRRSAHILGEQMQRKEIRKRYVAILEGYLESDGSYKSIKTRIRRCDQSTIMREVTDDISSPEAHTLYRVLAYGDRYTAVVAEPITGRTHQLRVHFSYLGYPILGDTMYGNPSDILQRQALHAFEISFVHPYTKSPITLESEIPDDILNAARTDNIDLSLSCLGSKL